MNGIFYVPRAVPQGDRISENFEGLASRVVFQNNSGYFGQISKNFVVCGLSWSFFRRTFPKGGRYVHSSP
jgi:hypothetical protein